MGGSYPLVLLNLIVIIRVCRQYSTQYVQSSTQTWRTTEVIIQGSGTTVAPESNESEGLAIAHP